MTVSIRRAKLTDATAIAQFIGEAAVVPLLAALTMAPAVRRIALQAGCMTLGPVRQFVKLIHTRPETVRRYLFSRTVHHPFINCLIRVGYKIFRAQSLIVLAVNARLRFMVQNKRNPSQWSEIDIAEIEAFGSEVDLLWNRVRNEYSALFVRCSRFLNCAMSTLLSCTIAACRPARRTMRRVYGHPSLILGRAAGWNNR